MTNDLIERVARAIEPHLAIDEALLASPQHLRKLKAHRTAQAAIAAIDLPAIREAAAKAALEAAATVAPSKTPSGECETVGQWTRRTLREAIRAIDPAAFRGDDHATG